MGGKDGCQPTKETTTPSTKGFGRGLPRLTVANAVSHTSNDCVPSSFTRLCAHVHIEISVFYIGLSCSLPPSIASSNHSLHTSFSFPAHSPITA